MADELDARRRILTSITDDGDRAAVLAVFHRIDWRRHMEAWTLDDVRQFAEQERDLHDPAQQEANGYERCAHCHYTRHPCSVYVLADMVLSLLDTHHDSI